MGSDRPSLPADHYRRLIADNASDVVFVGDLAMKFLWVSPSSETVLGWRPDELVGRTGSEFIHADDLAALLPRMAAAGPNSPLRTRFRFHTREGAYRWMSAAGRVFLDPHSDDVARVVSMRDIHDQVIAEQQLTEREELYRLLAENVDDVVLRTDAANVLAWVSPSVAQVLGWEPQALVGTPLADLVDPTDLTAQGDRFWEQRSADLRTESEARFRAADGTWRWMRVLSRSVRDAEGRPIGAIDTVREIEAEVAYRARLAFQADHDPLTGLANAASAIETIESLRAQGHRIALMTIGIDNLRAVNDAFTHAAGDRVLGMVADRLADVVDTPDQIARLAGNEFGVIIPDAPDAADLDGLAAGLQAIVESPVRIGGHDIAISSSLGIATNSDKSGAELIRDAGAARHQAKINGGHRREFLDDSMADRAREQLMVQNELREAIAERAIQPWFQPIVSLPGGRLVGYEALARWVRPDGSIVAPDTFIPIAERTGLILDMDLQVLEAALHAMGAADPQLTIAVNVAPATLSAPEFAVRARGILSASPVAPHRLHLEVTETTLLRPTDGVMAAMRDLAELGVTWWVDDFGTGYSSITILRDLPVRGLKLDRSFTSGILEDPTRLSLARGLAGLAHGLHLDTVAEGIEAAEEALVLAEQGWVAGQGYWFGRPSAALGG